MGETAVLFYHNEDAEKRFSDGLAEVVTARAAMPDAAEMPWIEAAFHDRLGMLYLARDKRDKARAEFDQALQLAEATPS